MMIALLLYAYATRQRSSRAIERHCRQDVAYRVITANRVPDHATIARFVPAASGRWPIGAAGEGERGAVGRERPWCMFTRPPIEQSPRWVGT
jgi:hypothetical protein